MKSIVLVLIGLLLGLGVMLLVPHGTPQVVYAGGTPSGNGDVNASGAIDIADAIYLLTYLFAKGPVPEPIESPACDSCCPPCPSFVFPAIGETSCFNMAGQAITCTSVSWPGQDGFYQTGCPMDGRFVDNGDGTVTDNCAGLMWQKDTADTNGDGRRDAQDRRTWQSALTFCENLTFAEHTDWRLPNIRELLSIVNYARGNPANSPEFTTLSSPDWWYWSSSTSGVQSNLAWALGADDGHSDDIDKPYDCYVRAVRTIQSGE